MNSDTKPGKQQEKFIVAQREEHESCEANTPGCCVDHTLSPDHERCETW